MKPLAARRKRDNHVVTAWNANPHDRFPCCQCGGAMQVEFGDPLWFSHVHKDCGGSKWLHDYTIEVLVRKQIGKCFALPGAGSPMHGRIESAPVAEAVIPKTGTMSSARRVDVGMKACLHQHNRNLPIGRLVIEVTNTSGKDKDFVADMQERKISACEFELGRMLHETSRQSKDLVTTRIVRWVNTSTQYKRWFWAEPAFKPAYNKWMRQRTWRRT